MTIEEHLRRLAESLPTNGSVVLTRTDLMELLGNGKEPSAETSPAHVDLTVAQVAERFGRSPQTVRDWIKQGKLRAYWFGREYRITPAALAEFEEGQRNGTRPQVSPSSSDLRAWRAVGSG